MAYTAAVKSELMQSPVLKDCCAGAELTALLLLSGSISLCGLGRYRLIFGSENAAVVRYCFTQLKRAFALAPEIRAVRSNQRGEHLRYQLQLEGEEAAGLLDRLGLGKVQFIGTEGAVLLGMVYNFLPFMVLPIYTALKKLDGGIIEAAEDLGANPIRVITRVVVPQSIPGVISGITMVFMPAVTTFAITRLLSNGMIYLVGDMIEEFYITVNNRNAGSAMSLVMLVLILVSTLLLRSINPAERKGGRA